ncbi:hypothetical protein ACH4Q7_22920 [Streptomyces roseolus]|uniref:hypothetical protein n=1 Tax=Streptomyces roseolus TaxID=67358 RepID=UPI003795A4F7
MFTEKSLPDGLALWELVEVLMTDFPPVREARAVGAAQREARALLNDAHMPDPMSERVTLLHETGLRYFGLANLIREAEELSARHPFVERRLAAWLEARPLAAELLGEEHDLVKNLAGEIFIASIEVKTKKKFGGRAESDPETRDSKLSEQEEWLAEEAPLGW